MVLLHINFLLNYLILEHFSLSYLLQLSKIDKKYIYIMQKEKPLKRLSLNHEFKSSVSLFLLHSILHQ